jgi:hypothetical protein
MANEASFAPTDFEAEFRAAFELSDAGISRHYFNGFSLVAAAGDVTLLLKHGEKGVALIAGSYPAMKELSMKLAESVKQMEGILGREFITLEDASKKMVEVHNRQQQKSK